MLKLLKIGLKKYSEANDHKMITKNTVVDGLTLSPVRGDTLISYIFPRSYIQVSGTFSIIEII